MISKIFKLFWREGSNNRIQYELHEHIPCFNHLSLLVNAGVDGGPVILVHGLDVHILPQRVVAAGGLGVKEEKSIKNKDPTQPSASLI